MARLNDKSAIDAHIAGLREAKAAFARLPEAIRERVAWENEKTAKIIQVQAQAIILHSPSVRTRALHNSIATRILRSQGRAQVGVADVTTTVNARPGILKSIKVKGLLIPGRNGSALRSEGARFVKPSRYAHLVEFGTRRMRAEPFMEPAAARAMPDHLERAKRATVEGCADACSIGGRFS